MEFVCNTLQAAHGHGPSPICFYTQPIVGPTACYHTHPLPDTMFGRRRAGKDCWVGLFCIGLCSSLSDDQERAWRGEKSSTCH